ncbi:Secreted protein, partial [Globisporangium splendens]
MNTKFAVLALAAIAATTSSAEDLCATASGELTKLVATTLIKAGTNYDTCKIATSSKFSFVPITGVPSDDVLAIMCATPECSASFKELLAKATTLLDCISFNSNSGAQINILRFMTNFDASCAAFTPAPTPAPETPAPTTPAPTTPAPTTPSPTTPAPTTPAPTTPAPTTPSPTTPAPTTPSPTTVTPGTPAPTVTPTTPEPTLPKPSC